MRKVRAAVAAILGAVAATGVCLWVFTRPMPTVGSVAEAAEPAKPAKEAKGVRFVVDQGYASYADLGGNPDGLSATPQRTTTPDGASVTRLILEQVGTDRRSVISPDHLRDFIAFAKSVGEKADALREELNASKGATKAWIHWACVDDAGSPFTLRYSIRLQKWCVWGDGEVENLPRLIEKALKKADELNESKPVTPW